VYRRGRAKRAGSNGTHAAAVAVRGIVAYPDGFEFRLVLWVRRPLSRGRRRGHPMWEPIMFEPLGLDRGGELPAEFLRFGIQFPDGASVTNLDSPPWELSPDATAPSHGMESSSGGGSDTHYEQDWWAWPVPDAGILAFVCEWPAHDIAETRYEVNADDIRRAAERALPVWPDLLGPSHVTRSQIMHHMTASHIRATESPRGDH
jgi:hypothetical protein